MCDGNRPVCNQHEESLRPSILSLIRVVLADGCSIVAASKTCALHSSQSTVSWCVTIVRKCLRDICIPSRLLWSIPRLQRNTPELLLQHRLVARCMSACSSVRPRNDSAVMSYKYT
jgi:hypothetical protein